MNTEKLTFIAVVALLSAALFAGGIWVVNKQKNRDKNDLVEFSNEIALLESRINGEIANTSDGTFIYSNPDSARVELAKIAEEIRVSKLMIEKEPNKALKQMADLEASQIRYTQIIDRIENDRDQNTANFVSNAKQQINSYKSELDKALDKNRGLIGQLAKSIKDFKGTKAQLEVLKTEKLRLEEVYKEQNQTRLALDSVINDRNELRDLLAKAQRQIDDLRKENDALTKREDVRESVVYGFMATYNFKGRDVELDDQGRHRPSQTEKLVISFNVGTKVFDDDGSPKQIILTLYKDGKPITNFPKTPVNVSAGKGKLNFEFKDRLKEGNYFFRATYKERQVMPDFKFKLTSLF